VLDLKTVFYFYFCGQNLICEFILALVSLWLLLLKKNVRLIFFIILFEDILIILLLFFRIF